MYDDKVREAVALYLTGALTAEEAAQRADTHAAELRHYARTCGAVVPAPETSLETSESDPV